MKKLFAVLLALCMALCMALPAAALEAAERPDVMAQAAYVVNLDANLVVYEKNSTAPLQAASLTKLMTALLLLQSYQDQLDTVTVTAPSYIYDVIWGYTRSASTADIVRGETHTLRNLLYAMMLPSANEAAYIVADYLGGGSIENFVARMNSEAEAIGCTDTVFADPSGLDENNVTTARDAYLIYRALTEYDVFAEVESTPRYDMGTNTRYTTPGTYLIQNTNKMLNAGGAYHRTYNRGGKTGSLGEWQNFVGWHSQDGESYISVLLGVPYEADPEGKRPALAETGTLMDWVFKSYTIAPALDTTQAITELPVRYATQADTIMLYPADNMMTLLPREGGAALTEQHFSLPQTLSAPVKQGDVVGTVTLTIGEEVVGVADLIAGSTIDRNAVLYTLSRVGEFFSSTYFKVLVVLSMIVLAVYVLAVLLQWFGVIKPAAAPKQQPPRRG